MPKIEIESLADLNRFLALPGHIWSNAVLQSVDLTDAALELLLLAEAPQGAALIGCPCSSRLSAHFAGHGAFIIPPAPASTGFDPFPSGLYDATTLVNNFSAAAPDPSYRLSRDWKAYLASMDAHTRLPREDVAADGLVLQRLHDSTMDDTLDEFLRPANGAALRVVAIMGGHDLPRLEKDAANADAPYMQAALLSWQLARTGFTIATGGGPGAMEAGNLGAWFAGRTEAELRAAVRILQGVPKIIPIPGSDLWNSGDWMAPAFAVRTQFPIVPIQGATQQSVGIPTWFYGHEPPNVFATHIAKYFQNSVREEGLLAIATHGVVFVEGNGGTVQEIFQDACQNYYAPVAKKAPMVLLGSNYWNSSAIVPNPTVDKRKPVYPLLLKMAQEKGFSSLIKLSDSVAEIVAFLTAPPPAA